MSYDRAKYDALRSSRVPHKLALSLASTDLPNIGADPDRTLDIPPIEPLITNANQQQNSEKINEIIDVLNLVLEFEGGS